MLAIGEQLSTQINRVFEEERSRALEELDELWRAKAADYDNEKGVMERSPLGGGSFIHELSKKVGRLEASWKRGEELKVEGLEEQLRDIANYAVAFLAFRRATARLAAVELKFVKVQEV